MNKHYNDQVGGFQKNQRSGQGGKSADERNKGRKFNKPRHTDKRSIYA